VLQNVWNVMKSEEGATELTSMVLILLGVGTIIAALIVIFRDELLKIVHGIFDNFATSSESSW
jgi:undecaprenyl pyrophosphate phosphatase UppP